MDDEDKFKNRWGDDDSIERKIRNELERRDFIKASIFGLGMIVLILIIIISRI